MDSSTPEITSENSSPEISSVSVVVSQTLSSTAPLFFPNNPSLHCYYFSQPPIYLLPPPSIFVYYPLSLVNPNSNQIDSIQEMPPLYSPSPRNGIFGRSRSKKVGWRRQIKHQDASNNDHMTTVMLRNIPNRYTREMMIEFIDKHCEEANKKEKDEGFRISAYDFFYLPIDFKSGMNKGYAFVNFINKEAVWKFKAACNHRPWSHFYSRKVLEIAYARIQGKDELVKHFEQMTYPAKAYSALCFHPARSGPADPVQTIIVGECTEPWVDLDT